jgi:hypothetical protein
MNSSATHQVRIVSAVPGRLRIKSRGTYRNPALLNRIKGDLEAKREISGVHVNPTTGSITVHYDSGRCDRAGILKWLQDIDVLAEDLMRARSAVPATAEPLTVIEAINDLNTRLSRWTGLPIDLRTVLPLAFAGAGLWSMVRNGLMIEKLPGWLLLWMGFDLFVKTRPHDRARSPRR